MGRMAKSREEFLAVWNEEVNVLGVLYNTCPKSHMAALDTAINMLRNIVKVSAETLPLTNPPQVIPDASKVDITTLSEEDRQYEQGYRYKATYNNEMLDDKPFMVAYFTEDPEHSTMPEIHKAMTRILVESKGHVSVTKLKNPVGIAK